MLAEPKNSISKAELILKKKQLFISKYLNGKRSLEIDVKFQAARDKKQVLQQEKEHEKDKPIDQPTDVPDGSQGNSNNSVDNKNACLEIYPDIQDKIL